MLDERYQISSHSLSKTDSSTINLKIFCYPSKGNEVLRKCKPSQR